MSATPGAGPVQGTATVLDNRPAGAYRRLRLATEAGRRAAPGQFVALAVGGAPTAMLLRRAFSLFRAVPDGPQGPEVELVVAAHGPGSRWVTELQPGDGVDLVGPLGRPFPLPAAPDPGHWVLVGGGYGSAPLLWLAEVAAARGARVDLVVGAASADRLFGADPGQAASGTTVTVTTDDGSAGHRGRVTDVLPPLLAAPDGAATVVACGPMAMLAAVGTVATEHGARAWCTVEESMACGVGVCMTCVLPVRGADGRTRMTRTCVEGPTFDAADVRWDALEIGPGGVAGKVPADCVGAPSGGGH